MVRQTGDPVACFRAGWHCSDRWDGWRAAWAGCMDGKLSGFLACLPPDLTRFGATPTPSFKPYRPPPSFQGGSIYFVIHGASA
jgi:hypothetical protein